MLTDYVCIRNGIIVLVETVIDLTVNKIYKKLKEELTVKVTNKINEFFALYNWDYGQSLQDTDVIKFLSSIAELSYITATFTTNDPGNSGAIVTAKFNEIIRPDTLTFNFTFE